MHGNTYKELNTVSGPPVRAKEMVAVLEVKRMTPVGSRGLPQRKRALCGPSGTSAVTWRLSYLTEITWTSLLFSITFLLGGLHEKSPFLLCNLCQRKKLMIAPLHEEKQSFLWSRSHVAPFLGDTTAQHVGDAPLQASSPQDAVHWKCYLPEE